MSFNLFGNRGFITSSEIDGFVDYLREGRVVGTTCKNCNEFYFPPRAHCDHCMKKDMKWVQIDGHCTLLTLTVIPPRGEENGFVLGLAQLVEGRKVLARISGSSESFDPSKTSLPKDAVLVPALDPSGRVSYEIKV